MIEVRLGKGTALAEAEPFDVTQPVSVLRRRGGVFARGLAASHTVLARPGLTGAALTAYAEGLLLGGYGFSKSARLVQDRVVVLTGTDDELALERARLNAAATCWARDLANTPANIKTPGWLASTGAARLGAVGVRVSVRDETWLAEHNFGGVLAVGSGAAAPPRLIEARWQPSGADPDRHVVLVGKGITFDSGGLNIKPADSMLNMKTDMAGGAAVLGALELIARLNLPVRVTALVPCAENSFGAGSFRPSDVVRHVNGRTSEITNTDAEGRLVLADALAYAAAKLKPSVIVDIATLTGAMKVALGLRTAGFFATDDALATQLTAAGEATGEPVWRMPLLADYEPSLNSWIADADNAPGNPGAITSALFLKHFVGRTAWAHIDIAGPARVPKDDGLFTQGATGFGARLLASWVESLAGAR